MKKHDFPWVRVRQVDSGARKGNLSRGQGHAGYELAVCENSEVDSPIEEHRLKAAFSSYTCSRQRHGTDPAISCLVGSGDGPR